MNNSLALLKTDAVKKGSMALLKLKRVSPEILAVVGVGGVIVTIVLASKATLKAQDVIKTHKSSMDSIEEASGYNDYTDEDAQKDRVATYIRTGKDLVRLYLPAVGLGVASISCLVGGQVILKKRNVALAAAYKVVADAFGEYRTRVIDELGNEKDYHFRYGTEYEKVIVAEEVDEKTGKTKKIKKEIQIIPDGTLPSMYARLFAEQIFDTQTGTYSGSSQWSPIPEYNASNLVLKNVWANEHLQAHGFLFLNEVYEELGFPKTKAGQMVGWVWQGDGDNYVSFGPTVDALINKTEGYTSYRHENGVLLDFNVDGMILDMIE